MTPLPAEPNPLVGTWKLVSFQFEAEGTNERLDVYDEHPVGFIIFTADWRVLALVTASERADDETARALFDRMMAYSDRYRLQVDGCFITIVDSAWYPACAKRNWPAVNQRVQGSRPCALTLKSRHLATQCCSVTFSTRASRAASGLSCQKKAVAIAVRNVSGRRRWSKLGEWLSADVSKHYVSA